MRKTFLIFTIMVLLFSGVCRADNIDLKASLEMNNVSVGNPLYLYVTLIGAQNVDRPETPTIDGLKVKYVGPSVEMSVVNGVVAQSITFTYLIIPLKGGSYEIGPFFVEHSGQMYKAGAVYLSVNSTPGSRTATSSTAYRSSSAPTSAPAPRQQSSQQTPYVGDRLLLTMDIEKDELYINESVTVIIKLYVEGMGLRDIEYPTYSHEGFSVGEFTKPDRHRENYRGVRYDVLEFRQKLFGIKEGDYTLGPATLNCKMVMREGASRRTSIFGVSVFIDDPMGQGYKTYPVELKSGSIPVTILPFPRENKPANFQGAVGNFNFSADVTPRDVKVGDPVTLKMTISGHGNLDTVTAPAIESSDKYKTYEPQVSKKGDRKTYEQIVIPKTKDFKEVPAVSFSYFNPRRAKYETITKGPFPIRVAEQPESSKAIRMVAMPDKDHVFYPQEELGEDIIHIKENLGEVQRTGKFLYNSWLFWLFQLVPLGAFLSFYAAYRKRERILTDKSYARSLKAPRKARSGLAKAKAFLGKGEVASFYDSINKTLVEYLGNRFNLAKGNVTFDVVDKRLRPAGCDEGVLDDMRDIFSRCDMARYAPTVPTKPEGEELMDKVKRVIDYLEKTKL
ncbi:BatD family protein [Candidatus Omnitrophota bacterium]